MWGGKTEKFKEIQQNFECYEFALQAIIKKCIKLNELDLTKVYIEYVPTKQKYGWIKGKFKITYEVEKDE